MPLWPFAPDEPRSRTGFGCLHEEILEAGDLEDSNRCRRRIAHDERAVDIGKRPMTSEDHAEARRVQERYLGEIQHDLVPGRDIRHERVLEEPARRVGDFAGHADHGRVVGLADLSAERPVDADRR